MSKRRLRKPKRPEIMQRNAVISSFTPTMRLSIRARTIWSLKSRGVRSWNFAGLWSNRSEMFRTSC